MAKKSATDWVESLSGSVSAMAEKIRDTAVTETRKYSAEMITDGYLSTVGRKMYGGKTPDECIVETLGYEDMASVPRLAAAREAFQESDAFAEGVRAGLLMAARMVADERYEL
jgi:hypothetical protein